MSLAVIRPGRGPLIDSLPQLAWNGQLPQELSIHYWIEPASESVWLIFRNKVRQLFVQLRIEEWKDEQMAHVLRTLGCKD